LPAVLVRVAEMLEMSVSLVERAALGVDLPRAVQPLKVERLYWSVARVGARLSKPEPARSPIKVEQPLSKVVTSEHLEQPSLGSKLDLVVVSPSVVASEMPEETAERLPFSVDSVAPHQGHLLEMHGSSVVRPGWVRVAKVETFWSAVAHRMARGLPASSRSVERSQRIRSISIHPR